MAKYPYEFKKQKVMEYLEGQGCFLFLTTKYNLGTTSQIRRWVSAYKKFGDDGLRRSRQQDKYSFEKKLSVVELYLSSEISYQDLAIQKSLYCAGKEKVWIGTGRVFYSAEVGGR